MSTLENITPQIDALLDATMDEIKKFPPDDYHIRRELFIALYKAALIAYKNVNKMQEGNDRAA